MIGAKIENAFFDLVKVGILCGTRLVEGNGDGTGDADSNYGSDYIDKHGEFNGEEGEDCSTDGG